MRFKLLPVILLALIPVFANAQDDPQAAPEAVVTSGNARFTVLTSRLIRMEWAGDAQFEDRATLAVVNRKLEVPSFRVKKTKNGVVITTKDLTLQYKGPGRFSEKNLSVTFTMADPHAKKGVRQVKWTPGMDDSGNLMGTYRTLDGCKGFSQINYKGDEYEQGVLSRDGWAVVDESARHILVKDNSDWGEWVAERPEGDRQDLYLFAYGHDYKAALKDFTRIAGRIPLPPKYVFGYWWSRYWQYSDFEFVDLAKEIRSHGIPMDVMVIDMDWHDTWTLQRKNAPQDEFGQRIGWTGYTWQKQLFPHPEKTLAQLHALSLKTSLNLHPASGIQPYEDCYQGFVKDYLSRTDNYDGPKGYKYHEGDSLIYLRSNPSTRQDRTAKEGELCPVPFRIDQQAWTDAYFNSVIHPLERQGVDFWWLDWQQWKLSEYTKGLSNTFWLNYTFFNDKVRRNRGFGSHEAPRPMIYHRWGGLGSHRYQIGFSGDCYDTWEVLTFLPYFTATSSNVGYGYWGHDIGGHQVQGDPYKPEIFTRWLQYGVFTPIFKTHCTKSADIERRIWTYAPEYAKPMREAVRLRYGLSPYIYTAARQAYDTGICMTRPMYYDYPENEESYTMKEQFMFGDDILATVIGEPADPVTGLASRTVWLPEGNDWYDMATGALYKGGQTCTLSYTLDENPWFVKAGAIIPMADENITSLQEKSNVQRYFVAPGDGKSSCRLYEDDGYSQDYANHFATTLVTKESSREACEVVIAAREGGYRGMPSMRRVQVILEGVFVPVSVTLNGKPVKWNYCGKDLSVVVDLPEMPASQEAVVRCSFDGNDPAILRGKKGIMHRMMNITPAFKDAYNENVDKYKLLSRPFLRLAQCPSLIESDPSRLVEFLQAMDVQAVEEDLKPYPGLAPIGKAIQAQCQIQAPPCAPKDSLKVISFNVRTSVKDDGENSWENRKEASKAMLEEQQPDIFGVQEAQPDQLAYIAGACPDYVPFGVGRDKGDDEGEHASIFYNRHTLEMVDGGTWWLSETPDVPSVGWDAKYPRTATWALMKDLRNGRQFYFVNTHLDHKGANARRNGLAMVVEKTRGLNPDIPLVLTGDFNVEPGDSCLVDVDRLMLSARKVAEKTTDAPSCNGFKAPATKTIDYIYFVGFEKALEFAVLDKSYAGKPFISDHYPVVSTLVY